MSYCPQHSWKIPAHSRPSSSILCCEAFYSGLSREHPSQDTVQDPNRVSCGSPSTFRTASSWFHPSFPSALHGIPPNKGLLRRRKRRAPGRAQDHKKGGCPKGVESEKLTLSLSCAHLPSVAGQNYSGLDTHRRVQAFGKRERQ